jgi:hypothetical protein
MKNLKGDVTISIEDFQALLDTSTVNMEIRDNLKAAARELEVFLSFICGRIEMEKHIDEFNKQSNHSTINITNGRAKINMKNEYNN